MIRAVASWCDLVKHVDGRVDFVYLQGARVECETHAAHGDIVGVIRRWSVEASQPLLYLRAAANTNGAVCAIGQGHQDGQAWATIAGGAPFTLGPTHGVFPVLIFGDSLGWVAFIQRTASTYDMVRIHSAGGHVRVLTGAMPPTSQGFLYVASTGQPITQDQGRGAIPGLALPSPAPSDPRVWVGQSMTAETLALFDSETGQITSIKTPGGQPPHIVESEGTYYVCSWVNGGAWLSTHRRPFGPSVPPPERLPEGTEIDLLPFLVGEASTWPRHGDHYMHQTWDGRNLHFLKFGPVAEGSTFGDAWERLVLDGDQFYLREDRSQSGAGIYSFHPGRAFKRRMNVGQWIDVPENMLQRYEKGTCRVIDQHPLPYRIGLVEAWRNVDCGGDLGIRDVIRTSYDPGGAHDTIEHFWYARGAGWFRWQEQRQTAPFNTHTTTFNRIGGVSLTPTQGCWKRDLVPWPPDAPDDDEDGMTKQELIGTAIHREFVLGAWTRFINEVALARDVIDGTTRGDNLTDTVGTRGLAMYFFPLYYRATMQAIDRLGHVPRNPAEWGGVSIAGFEAAKAVYVREQGGTPSPSPVEPGPSGPSIITGRLRKEGRALADDAGYSLPVFCHSGTGIADLLYDEATERHNASLIKSVGYAGRRVWTRLRGTAPWSTNPQGWGGREFGHETMGDDAYRNLLIASFRQHQELGLKLALSAGDIEGIDNEHEIRKYVRLLGDALETVSPDGSLCAIFESGNELPGIWRNGSPERARDWILKPFKARFRDVLCTNSQGANESREERFRWCLDPADLDDIHSFRDNHWFDWIRHVINNAYVHEHGAQPRELIWGSEPFGTGGLVSVQPRIGEYDEHVAQISVIAHLMTGQIPCYFCSPGIRYDVARDRYGETYEAMPGFATCASVASLLPADIMTWPRENIVHGGRPDPPGSPNPIFEEPGLGEIDRAYHVFSADHRRFAALIFGGESLDSRPYRPYTAVVDHRFGNKARLVVGQAT
jgi:hypothetical protein